MGSAKISDDAPAALGVGFSWFWVRDAGDVPLVLHNGAWGGLVGALAPPAAVSDVRCIGHDGMVVGVDFSVLSDIGLGRGRKMVVVNWSGGLQFLWGETAPSF